MNIKKMAYKLQMALCQKGKIIKINQHQNYSQKAGGMVTQYVLQEVITTSKGKRKSVTIFESYQMADVVKFLAELYGGG